MSEGTIEKKIKKTPLSATKLYIIYIFKLFFIKKQLKHSKKKKSGHLFCLFHFSNCVCLCVIPNYEPICRSVATAYYCKDYKPIDGDTSCLSNTDSCTSLKVVRCWGIEATVLTAEGAETSFGD